MKASLVFAQLTVCATLAAAQCHAQETSPCAVAIHDLRSIIDAKVLRVAVTRFDFGYRTVRLTKTRQSVRFERAALRPWSLAAHTARAMSARRDGRAPLRVVGCALIRGCESAAEPRTSHLGSQGDIVQSQHDVHFTPP
jgi:hypothetical protein